MRRPLGRRELLRAIKKLVGAKLAPQPAFIEPCLATARNTPPSDRQWIHEIKHDGYRAQARLSHGRTIVHTRRGYDWSETFSSIAEAVSTLPAREAILDGEVVVLDERGISDFGKLQEAL